MEMHRKPDADMHKAYNRSPDAEVTAQVVAHRIRGFRIRLSGPSIRDSATHPRLT